jgi:hypothetical protein
MQTAQGQQCPDFATPARMPALSPLRGGRTEFQQAPVIGAGATPPSHP